MSTRQAIRDKRDKERRQRQVRTVLIIGGIGVLVAGLLALINLRPVGNINDIAVRDYPNADGLALGNPDAPVVVEEYADFQCPHCKTWSDDTEPLLIQNYIETGRVRLVFRHFPILGPESTAAASASMCANEQGSFWPYHDLIFANQSSGNTGGFSNERLVAFADHLGLDVEAFDACLRSNRYISDVNADFQNGQDLRVPGTPGIVVNGQLLENSSYDFIAPVIEAALAASGG